jgi:hypothetical protein
MEDEIVTEISTPAEMKVNELIQVLAVLLGRLGGEIVVSHKEFSMFEGVPIFGRNLSAGYLRLRFGDEDEDVEVESEPNLDTPIQ